MALKFAIQTVLEIAVVVLIIYGFIREDKLIAFEDRVRAKIRAKKETVLILEKTADAPGSGQKWRRKKVCKSCHWLRKIDCAGDGWDGKCCAYTYITDRFREIPATNDCCAYYLKKKGAKI